MVRTKSGGDSTVSPEILITGVIFHPTRIERWLLLDSRVVEKTMLYNPICASCILLESLIFQEPYKCIACFNTFAKMR